MKTYTNNDEYIIAFDEETIDDLTPINEQLKKIPTTIKSVIFNLQNVKYINSVFVDYLIKFHSILEQNNTKLKITNCSDSINALITKSYKNHKIEIKLKDI